MEVFYDGEIFTQQRHGGISLMFRQLVERVSDDYPDVKVVRYRFPDGDSATRRELYFTPGVGQALRTFDRLVLPFSVRRADPDVYHPTYYRVPRGTPGEVVVTVHDMIPEQFPEVGGVFNRYIRAAKRTALERASHVIAVSENTKRDLVRMTDVRPGGVTVIPPAPNPWFRIAGDRPASPPPEAGDGDYLLYVGRRDSYKNFATLLRAYAEWSANADVGLVCAGGSDEWSGTERAVIGEYGLGDRVRLAGTVPQEELYVLYRDALAFVYPSKYEGFGIPPLEAMLCGTPVVVSDAASIPEVVGDAGCYVDPCDEASVREGLDLMLDAEERRRLVEAGRERVERFTWDETTRRTVEVYEAVA